jgi:hypothetical protein
VVSVAVLAAVVSPVARDPARSESDGFPLSTYPMFARPRSTVLAMDYALGLVEAPADGADGDDRRPRFLAPRLVGSSEVLQARAILARAIGAGRGAQAELCTDIAARVAAEPALAAVTAVALVSGRHDAIELLVRGVRGRETERFRCPVLRPARAAR